jgi:hypothetical protein
LVASWELPCYIDGYPFERGPNSVLVHVALNPGPWAPTGCTGVALWAQFLNIASCLEPEVPFVDTHVTSGRPTM